jgi:hypothetical protein
VCRGCGVFLTRFELTSSGTIYTLKRTSVEDNISLK